MADSGWGAGAIGAFGAMIGSVVGAGIAGAALQSKKFRHVSSDHRQRALLLTTAGTGVVGALAAVKVSANSAQQLADLRSRCQHLEQENQAIREAQQADLDRFDRYLQNYSSGYTQALDDALKGKP